MRAARLAAMGLLPFAAGCTGPVRVFDVRPAPDFTLPDVQGRSVTLSEHKGKVVIVDFWATWCAPCLKELPVFQQLQDTYRDKGLQVIGISVDDNPAEVVPDFLKDLGITYTNLMGDEKVTDLYAPIEGIPTIFVIDRDGQIRRKAVGAVPKDKVEAWINELL